MCALYDRMTRFLVQQPGRKLFGRVNSNESNLIIETSNLLELLESIDIHYQNQNHLPPQRLDFSAARTRKVTGPLCALPEIQW